MKINKLLSNLKTIMSFMILLSLSNSCKKSNTAPSVNKAEFQTTTRKYLKGDIVSITNSSNGLISQEWYDNGVLFDNTIKPSNKVFSVGKHIIKLLGKNSDGTIFEFNDSFAVYDKIIISKFKITNKLNTLFKSDSNYFHLIGFYKKNAGRTSGDIGLRKVVVTEFATLSYDTAFKTNQLFTNYFLELKQGILNEPNPKPIFLVDLMKNCSFVIVKTVALNVIPSDCWIVDEAIVSVINDLSNNMIILKSANFEISVFGELSYQ